jgi:hypothetical protein
MALTLNPVSGESTVRTNLNLGILKALVIPDRHDEIGYAQCVRSVITDNLLDGRVPERPNGTVSKTVVGASSPGVQIPPLPPDLFI